MASVLLESKPFRPFKSSEEYLEAMREDLAEWLNSMYPELMINADNFMDRLDTGVALCKHANNVLQAAENYLVRRQMRNKSMIRSMTSGLAGPIVAMGNVHYLQEAKSGTFFARDNVSNFITWCRKALKIFECLLFETDDLIMRKNEKHVILCLLEVARIGAKFGMEAPMLIKMERQIDREIAAYNKSNGIRNGLLVDCIKMNISVETEFDTDTEDEDDDEPMLMYGPQPQIITNDLKSLDEMVRNLVEKCTCPSQFPMVRVSDGKYRIGDTKVLIFVRILRSHVMVRVGGGWDTLSHYLDKHDPCRCRTQHRSPIAAKLIPRTNNQTNGIELHKAQVVFERSPPVASPVVTHNLPKDNGNSNQVLSKNKLVLSPSFIHVKDFKGRSQSPTPQKTPKMLGKLQHGSGDSSSHTGKFPGSSALKNFAGSKKSTGATKTSTNTERCFQSLVSAHGNENSKNMSNQSPSSLINLPVVEKTLSGNISDDSSEISDEGYRSFGIMNSGNTTDKKESINNRPLIKDSGNNDCADHHLSGSEVLPANENFCTSKIQKAEDLNYTKSSKLSYSITQTTPTQQEQKNTSLLNDEIEGKSISFQKSGVFITDNDITVDIANVTNLWKTGNDLHNKTPKQISSKIPRSPMVITQCCVDDGKTYKCDPSTRTNAPVPNSKQRNVILERLVKSAVTARRDDKLSSSPYIKNSNTWSGRSVATKKRPPLASNTFFSPIAGDSRDKLKTGSSELLHDNNGRSKTSIIISPTKNNVNSSPLKLQLLETAGRAKSDAQILEKMEELLIQYSNIMDNATEYKDAGTGERNNFKTTLTNNNGILNRSNTCVSPIKRKSKHSSATSSLENICNQTSATFVVSPRKDRGLSKIPAPVRNHTDLY